MVVGGACCLPLLAWAHGGGLNAEGCQTNRKTGDYHCHRATKTLPVQPAMPLTEPADDPPPRSPETRAHGSSSTCYTGPRGGSYTITKSGKKNYAAC